MSWDVLLELIADELGDDSARRIEERARLELGGMRITISKRRVITRAEIEKIAPGKPLKAAAVLGVHHSTVYRALNRQRIIR